VRADQDFMNNFHLFLGERRKVISAEQPLPEPPEHSPQQILPEMSAGSAAVVLPQDYVPRAVPRHNSSPIATQASADARASEQTACQPPSPVNTLLASAARTVPPVNMPAPLPGI